MRFIGRDIIVLSSEQAVTHFRSVSNECASEVALEPEPRHATQLLVHHRGDQLRQRQIETKREHLLGEFRCGVGHAGESAGDMPLNYVGACSHAK